MDAFHARDALEVGVSERCTPTESVIELPL